MTRPWAGLLDRFTLSLHIRPLVREELLGSRNPLLAAAQSGAIVYGWLRKYPQADREWGWQWVFPAAQISVDPRSGERRRHHLHESVLQKAVREATQQASLTKSVSCHTLRHSFATGVPRVTVKFRSLREGR